MGLHASVLGKWRRHFESKGFSVSVQRQEVDSDPHEEISRLRAENRCLQMERDILLDNFS